MLGTWRMEKHMNKLRKLLTVILLAVLTILTSANVYASEKQNDGIIVTLTTDKQEYDTGEKIVVDLNINNTNDYSVTLTNAKNIIPEGFLVDSSTTNELNNIELKIGESTSLRTGFNESVLETIQGGNTNNNTNIDSNVNTGDTSSVNNLVSLLGASALLLFLFVTMKYRNLKKSLSVFLCFGIISMSLLSNIKAGGSTNEIIVDKEITYGGRKIKLSSKVSYTNNNTSDPKDPVVYQEGIEETYLEYDLDEEHKKVTILDNKVPENWAIGQIHVLKNKSKPSDDIAIEIESITRLDNGNTTIIYKAPDLAKVIESIDYSGVEMQQGVITPAEGVTFLDEEKAPRSRFGLDIEETGKFNLFKKHNFKVEDDGIEFNAELYIKRINYDFKLSSEWFSIDLEKAYLTLDSSLKLGVNAKEDFGGEKKIKLASFEASIGYGFFAVGEIFAYFSANGELTLDYTINATCGFDYKNDKFKGVWKLDSKLNEAKADVNLKVGATAEPKLNFLKIGLVGGEFNFGRNYELKLDEISLDPIEFCLDAGYYNYASVSSIFLPGSWDKKFTAELFGKDNTPMKEMIHIEEGTTVAECTRKFGSLEGTVQKQEGEYEEPLNLADVSLQKDGEVLHSTKTDGKGDFFFGQEIEKGTYDIVVKSNHYETYNGKVKIIGNKKNVIEKPIVLKPYGELIKVTGFIYDAKTQLAIADATVDVEGLSDISTKTDSNGNYILEIPKGKRKIVASAPSYSSNSYVGEFSQDATDINIALSKEKKDNYEVLTINAGESYQLDFTTSKRIFVRFETDGEFSSYQDGQATYHKKRAALDEYYTGVEQGSHMEIKVFEGTATIFANDGGFDQEPDSDLSDYCVYTNMNGVDPFIDLTLKAGDSKTFDYQIDLPKTSDVVIHAFSNNIVTGTEAVTDYYWNTHMGWELSTNVYELNGKINFWRPLANLVKDKISITSGELTIYYYRLADLAVY